MKLNLIHTELLTQYISETNNIEEHFELLEDVEISTDSFSFYTSVAVMSSSKIEGEKLEIDSYVKHKMLKIDYLKDLVQKPNDLYEAYIFAQKNKLTESNFLKAHKLISKHLLALNKRGKYRKVNMLIMEHKTFRVQYEAVLFDEVQDLMKKLWLDIKTLINFQMSHKEVFYYASFIHLVFVNIHPFEDGNGRSGRLLEKWFISEKLGENAWFLQSELHYYKNIENYYKGLNRLGLFYEQLDYSKALPFLLMLPNCLQTDKL